MWYGKAPGVDRSGDILRHANFAGVGRHGGVLALAGDDPQAKSSTLPTHSEVAFYDFHMPVLFPGKRPGHPRPRPPGVRAVALFGAVGGLQGGDRRRRRCRHRGGASRPGLDRGSRIHLRGPSVGRRASRPGLLPPYTLDVEREIVYGRLEAARAFAAANGLNRITVPTRDAWLGIVAAGKAYYDLRQALADLGLDDAALRRHGIRLLKLGMLFPLERGIVREFARGLEELLVVEEKRGFLELLLREALYELPDRPRIVGKRDDARPGAGAGRRRAGRRRGRPRRRPAPRRPGRPRLGPGASGGHRGGARAAGVAHPGAARPSSARGAPTTARPSCPRARWPPAGSAVTASP